MSYNRKRIGHEVMELVSYCGPVNVSSRHNDATGVTTCLIRIMLFDLEVVFEVGSRYPFTSPVNTLINGKDYYRLVGRSMDRFRRIGQEIGYPRCFCCDSLLCDGRWSPAVHLTRLYQEMKDVVTKKQHIMHVYFCRRIAAEKLTHDIPLELYL